MPCKNSSVIEMPFGAVSQMDSRNRVLDGGRFSHRKGQFSGRCASLVKSMVTMWHCSMDVDCSIPAAEWLDLSAVGTVQLAHSRRIHLPP